MEISFVGGVYKENCAWPANYEVLGSAGRAALCVVQLDSSTKVELISSFSNEEMVELKERFVGREVSVTNYEQPTTYLFSYDHPLSEPVVEPKLTNETEVQKLELDGFDGKQVVMFGMIEKDVKIKCKSVIYDPQNSASPKLFSANGSLADELIYVLNRDELGKYYVESNGAEEYDIERMASWLLDKEGASAVIVKCGARGAFVFTAKEGGKWLCSYRAKKVSPIGSGDSFVAAFAYYYFVRRFDAFKSANLASVATSFYVEHSMMISDKQLAQYQVNLVANALENESNKKNIYLAGPFFNMGQMWLINQSKIAIEKFGMSVFSPYHELGIGPAEVVAQAVIKAIDECDVLYALFDDHDPGTLFEIGYAIKAGKKVVIYTEQNNDEHLKMFEGTGCEIIRDFATSIYTLSWM